MNDKELEELVLRWTGYVALLLTILAAVAFAGQ